MRRLFRRSLLGLLLVVIVPLGALVVMQYRFLRSLEAKTASAERNWLRTSLEIVVDELESRYRAAANSALTMSEAELQSVATLGERFRRNPVPGAQTFFAMRFHHDKAETGYFDLKGVEKIPSMDQMEAVKLATVSWHVAHKWQRVAQPTVLVDERDPRHRILLRPVVDASWHVVGVVGAILQEEKARAAMTRIGQRALHDRYPRSLIEMKIGDDFPRTNEWVTRPLGFVFTNWRAGIRDTCASPEEVARIHFRNNSMWTGGAFFILLGAIGLAMHAAARQMRVSQMKSDFVSNVSHELRTPLSSIRVFGEYMRLGRVTKQEKIQEYGEYIEAESRRLTQLINNILDFSKIESAEKKYHFCETDVAELVEQTVSAFEVPLRESGVSIRFSAPAPHPPLMLIDKDAIAQAVMNLLDNAFKYSNGRKEVEVSVTARGAEVCVSVRDHGIGIPAAEQKKIFEKFYRVGSGLVHDVKGSGLGLSIVLHVVKAHGGRVEVESTPGDGSTFTIVLPGGGQAILPVRNPGEEYA